MRRRAVAALQRIAVTEGTLQVVDFAAVGQPFDGLDGPAICLHRKHQTGAHDLIVHAHRAGAADAVLAADMRSRQVQMLAQEICKIEPRQHLRFDALTIHLE